MQVNSQNKQLIYVKYLQQYQITTVCYVCIYCYLNFCFPLGSTAVTSRIFFGGGAKIIKIHFGVTCNFNVSEICLNTYTIIGVISLNVNSTDSYHSTPGCFGRKYNYQM